MNWKFTLFAVLVMVSVSAYAVISECSDGSEAASDDSGSCGHNVTYVFDSSTGTLTISGSGYMYPYSYFDNAPWYSYRSDVKKIVIEDGVTSISDYAFSGCSSLASVTIPDGVTSIGSSAFDGCTSLVSITIPDGVTSIGSSAFDGCTSLVSVTIPDSVTSIGDYAFSGCTGLEEIVTGNCVTSIGECAFSGCSSLASVTIPDSVTSISLGAFFGCSSLTSIVVAEGNAAYRSVDGVLFSKDMKTLLQYPAGRSDDSYIIPDSVTSISLGAFSGCSSLASITIPDSVTSIGSSAFDGCTSLVSVTIPDGVTSIGFSAFYGCSSLASVTIPDSVTSIGDDAFSECSSLASITIPDSVTSIGQFAFYGCTAVSSIRIGPDVSSIGDRAFGDIVFYDKDAVSVLPTDANSLKGGCFVKTDDRMVKVDGHMMSFYVDGKVVYRGVFVEGDEDTHIPDVPFRPGYICSWEEFELGTEDVSVNAAYVLKCYHVEFVFDGILFFAYDLEYGKEITLPSGIPSKDADVRYVYTFSGWDGYTDGMVLGDDDVTFTAVFDSTVRKYSYTVEYVDGEGNAIADPLSGTADYGSTVDAEIKTITGYAAPSGISHIAISEDESKNVVRYVYTMIQYDVVYKVDGETVFTDTFGYGTEVTVRDMFQKTGYTVTDWSTDDAEVSDGKFVLGASDVTFSAVSAANKYSYTIEYVDGEGNAIADPLSGTADYGSTVDAEIKDIVGYTAPSKTVMVFVSEDESKNVVTYVYTIIVYTITFDDGTVQTDIKYTVKASSVDEPPITKKKGYTGVWEEYALDLTDKTVKAVYAAESYHVEFISDGAVFFAYGLEYGKEITLPSGIPSKDADGFYTYAFSGWDGYTEDMTVDGDRVFNALFSRSVIANTGEDGGYEVKADGEGAPFSSETISGIVDGASSDPSVTMSVSVGDTLVSFDNEALRNLHGDDADLLVSRLSYGQMTQAVRDVVGHNVAYSISFGPNRDFGNGTVTVTIPYVLAEGKDPNGLFVYYVAEDGTVEEIPCTYSEGYVTFSTDHFSVYAVMYEEPPSDGGPSDSMTVFTVIGIVIAVGAVGVGAMMFVKKKRA